MADEYIRTEGDYQYWRTPEGDEYKRWAPGNSQDKQPSTLAERHPKAVQELTSDRAQELASMRTQYKLEAMRTIPPSRYSEFAAMIARRIENGQPSDADLVKLTAEIRQMLGLSVRHETGGDGQPIAIQVNLGADLLQAYVDRMDGNAIDVSTAENEDL